jgi:hypothetical protein
MRPEIARRSRAQIYDPSVLPFFHLPYEALLYAPFALASYRSAYLLFIGFNLAMLLGLFLAGPFSGDSFCSPLFPSSWPASCS